MHKTFGTLIKLLGWLCAGWFGVVGGSFSAIYLLGFIGTGGREAGQELILALAVTAGGVIIGLLLAKFGDRVASHGS